MCPSAWSMLGCATLTRVRVPRYQLSPIVGLLLVFSSLLQLRLRLLHESLNELSRNPLQLHLPGALTIRPVLPF